MDPHREAGDTFCSSALAATCKNWKRSKAGEKAAGLGAGGGWRGWGVRSVGGNR